MSDNMTLPMYVATIANLHDGSEEGLHKINELREIHGSKTATYDDVEQAVALMVRSVLRDNAIGEQVQGVFNELVSRTLIDKGVFNAGDVEFITTAMRDTTEKLYQEDKGDSHE